MDHYQSFHVFTSCPVVDQTSVYNPLCIYIGCVYHCGHPVGVCVRLLASVGLWYHCLSLYAECAITTCVSWVYFTKYSFHVFITHLPCATHIVTYIEGCMACVVVTSAVDPPCGMHAVCALCVVCWWCVSWEFVYYLSLCTYVCAYVISFVCRHAQFNAFCMYEIWTHSIAIFCLIYIVISRTSFVYT